MRKKAEIKSVIDAMNEQIERLEDQMRHTGDRYKRLSIINRINVVDAQKKALIWVVCK